MNKAELESKNLSELHKLAADAGVERYRMLSRAELIVKLGGGSSQSSQGSQRSSQGSQRAPRSGSSERGERPPRRRRSRGPRKPTADDEGSGREPRSGSRPKPEPAAKPEPASPPEPAAPAPAAAPESSSSRPRRRRRRRFGRRGKEGVTLQGLLLPPAAGRQAVVAAETREACTALLRGIAADLSDESNGGPDPVALLIDPTPEELAEWRRDAPKAEIVAAGQPRHASDALAQATTRASNGDHVILLVDSLTRLGEAHDDPDAAKQFFDAGRVQAGAGGGSLTVVAALERPAS
jgi:transcription termination factor Rho